ncbi:MAG: hypothetical protein RLN99_06345 [Kiloniellaceae bacterium]
MRIRVIGATRTIGNSLCCTLDSHHEVIRVARTGATHRVGAHLLGAPSCNGWSFWHVITDGKPVSIDVLRQKLRANLPKTMN